MKALTLTQPWASLMALQAKTIETRSWYTNYRGELIIHAAKGFPKWAKETCEEPEFAEALGSLKADQLPLSVGLCVVRLLHCIRTESVPRSQEVLGFSFDDNEYHFGDYTEGRYAWLTEFVQPLQTQPVRGALGLWEWRHPLCPECGGIGEMSDDSDRGYSCCGACDGTGKQALL